MRWVSINDIKRLVKQELYRLETGSRPGDQLVYDRASGKYVGHIEQGRNFVQDRAYEPPVYIVKMLDEFDNDWQSDCQGW